jgi:peptidyl-tRNA hydrolase
VVDYVLSPPRREEGQNIEEAIHRASDQLDLLLEGNYAQVMNRLHSR